MSESRIAILKSLSAKGRKLAMPTPWTSKNKYKNLSYQFALALQKAKGEVHLVSGEEEAWKVLGNILSKLNAQKIVVDGDESLEKRIFEDIGPDLQWITIGNSEGDLRSYCIEADVGLTGADAALAETGSVILKMNARRSRLVSLLPPVHIVLLPISKIVPDIFSWIAERDVDMPSQLIIISGPSKTADIEQTLVVGVHGPKRFIVIVYDD
ncbi:MAG: lactate utilization protein [Anaerolineales bacterium]|jgi:L-lactate dehydrogenase complex protein LldG